MTGPGPRLAVDFGTSTTVAVLQDRRGQVRQLLFDASPLLGSGVFAGPDPDAELLTGGDAERAAVGLPQGFEPYPKQRVDDGAVWLAEREVPVADLIAAVLERVAAEARRVGGGLPHDVVLTHPSSWRRLRRGLLAGAAAQAGLGAVQLVAEPVAAAAYYVGRLGHELPDGRCLVVYDLGAGTFDVSVVRRAGAGFTVLAHDGLADVGGVYLDAAIVEHVRTLTADRPGAAGSWAALDRPRSTAERRVRYQLQLDARAVKEQLSRRPAADLHVPLVGADVHITRAEFEALARPYLERTTALTASVLRSVGVGPDDLAGVFLVGGSSRVPLAATLLHRTLRVAPTTLDLPELVVAEGALEAVAEPAPPFAGRASAGRPASPQEDVTELRAAAADERVARRDEALHLAGRLLRGGDPSVRTAACTLLLGLVGDADAALARRARELWYASGLGALPGPQGGAVIGIDMGAGRSAVAVLERGRAVPVPNAEGALGTPSVVAVTADGSTLTGAAAARQALTNPDFTVRAPGLLLGTGWTLDRAGVRYTAEDLVTVLLARLHADAEDHLGGPVHGAVLTVPASFDQVQRLALAGAARRAGLPVLRLISAPAAALLGHGAHHGEDQTVLLVDLGAGTLDVALAELGDGVVELKATAGDQHLGGDDWDRRIAEQIAEQIRQDHGLDLAAQPAALARLREAAEAARIELSAAGSAQLHLPYLGVSPAGPVHVTETLTRSALEAQTRDLLHRCRGPVDRVVIAAGVAIADVDRVVLTGGAARMPAVAELVRGLTGGRAPYRGLAPEAVVTGAALQAGILTGHVKDTLVLETTGLDLGFELAGGAQHILVPRYTPIPHKAWTLVTTGTDGQTSLLVRLCEGDHPVAASNRPLAAFELTGLPTAPKGLPEIELEFDIDANGIMAVTARDRVTGSVRTVVVDAVTAEDAAQAAGPASTLPVPLHRSG
ncbi:Hsp70 family protein [Dactylosporangium sp. AC04546]|uniref:Hsp70 family protein n=1 Tax=Dactylosporangium sp. AC04546 TaxID=2862460 RepID=UPI001EE12373|nr:Hsp70 family protein [Dactylosporangium sp. AC04546]WVK87498.1 Hsp70 family protein [Dactylosporangium sp. AC04546]